MSNRLIIKNSFYLYIRLIVVAFIGLLNSRFVLKALGTSDYGLYNVVGGVVTLMAFINTVMVSTTYRYIAVEQGKINGDVNRIFNISLVIHLVIVLLVVMAAVTIGQYYINNYLKVPTGKLSDALFVFWVSLFNTICVIVATPYQGFLIANEKFNITIPIELGTKALNLILVIILNYLSGNRLRIYVVFVTIVHMLNPIMYISYCYRKYCNTVKWKFQKEFSKYKEMLGYSSWIMLGAASSVGESQGSALIINRFFGTILNASFGIANQVNSIVRMFSSSLGQAVIPQITKSYSAGDHNRASFLVNISSKYSTFLLLIPMLPILLETKFILHTWLTIVPEYSTIFVWAILLKSLLLTTEGAITNVIAASGKIKMFQITSSVITLSSLPIAYFAFLKGYKPYYISIIYIFTTLIMLINELILMKVIINYDIKRFFNETILRELLVIFVISPLFIVQLIIPYGWVRFIIVSISAEIWLLSAIYFLGMNQNERKKIICIAKEYLYKILSLGRNICPMPPS